MHSRLSRSSSMPWRICSMITVCFSSISEVGSPASPLCTLRPHLIDRLGWLELDFVGEALEVGKLVLELADELDLLLALPLHELVVLGSGGARVVAVPAPLGLHLGAHRPWALLAAGGGSVCPEVPR